jgi:hypothetical protein
MRKGGVHRQVDDGRVPPPLPQIPDEIANRIEADRVAMRIAMTEAGVHGDPIEPVMIAIDRCLETLAVVTATHTRLIELTVKEAHAAADAEIQRSDAAIRAIEASAGEKILAAISQRVDDALLHRVRLRERQWLVTAGGVLLVITIALCAGAYAFGSYQASLGRLMETCRGGEIRKDAATGARYCVATQWLDPPSRER